jgi:NAD(P)-dependent dehydrogenase (short-subunit alcohol dehydrogenase family)
MGGERWDIEGPVALVMGVKRGIGRAFARAWLGNGAAKVYGAAHEPESVADQGITPLRPDVTRAASARNVYGPRFRSIDPQYDERPLKGVLP